MTEQEQRINQTQFSFEEPIFEDQAVYMGETPEEKEVKPKSKRNLIFIGIVGFILFLLLIVVLLFASRNNKTDEVIEDENIVVVTKEMGPLQKRIEDARELLDTADPTKQDLSFPPLDMDIRLDPKTR